MGNKAAKVHKVHGAWKVAFADFAVAMMAFFLLLWIVSITSPAEKNAISEYFQNPKEYAKGAAAVEQATIVKKIIQHKVADDNWEDVVNDEIQEMQKLKIEIENIIELTAALASYKEQIYLDITPEGLRIQIFDTYKKAMFPRSSAKINSYAAAVLANLAPLLNKNDNRISIAGHTDAIPFQKNGDYTNWELSVDRANAARNALIAGGLRESKIAMVVGLGSTVLFDAANPENPANRRISMIILNKVLDQANKNQETKLNTIIKNSMPKQ